MSTSAVEAYRVNLMRKLGMRNKAHLVYVSSPAMYGLRMSEIALHIRRIGENRGRL
ncbi:MAG: hypothetical protein GX358_04215 [candidate division WS1 bacterium]|nr:hypothetical protein [candidate division WS1 bacterium]